MFCEICVLELQQHKVCFFSLKTVFVVSQGIQQHNLNIIYDLLYILSTRGRNGGANIVPFSLHCLNCRHAMNHKVGTH